MDDTTRSQVASALRSAATALLAGLPDDPMEFQEAFMGKYPAARPLLRYFKGTVRGEARGSEAASYEIRHGKYVIILKEEFYKLWQQHGDGLALSVYAHELGHVAESELGLSWIRKHGSELGLDVWTESAFSMPNMSESFAETFAVLLRRDQRGARLLKEHWPLWETLVRDGAKKVGVRLP